MIDYHIHTLLCNHATGSMPEYIQQAIAIGLKEICFLDHLTINPSGKLLSMTPGEVPVYYHAIQMLKQKYKGIIKIKSGLEIDFTPDYVNLVEDILGTYSFDLIGSSLHFIDDINIVSSSSPWKKGQENTDAVFYLYCERLYEMMEYDYFDVVCHFDIVKKFGRKLPKKYDKKIDRILSVMKEKGIVMEINTSGLNHPAMEIYPHQEILKECCIKGIPVTIGSDAHRPEQVGQHFDRGFDLIVSAGYSHITVFSERSAGTIAIDCTHRYSGQSTISAEGT
ncbi:MAG: histidinol-phosphatase [Deltaproteobacteria bacterium]|nr:histidinol-phosphatase [Deltaproteobacteria bacterium]